MPQITRQSKVDENRNDKSTRLQLKKNGTEEVKRPVFNDLANKVIHKQPLANLKSNNIVRPDSLNNFKNVKPRIDTNLHKAGNKKISNINGAETITTTVTTTNTTSDHLVARLVRTRTTQTAKIQEAVRITIPTRGTKKSNEATKKVTNNKVNGTTAAAAAANLQVNLVRQESLLSRRSLTRLRDESLKKNDAKQVIEADSTVEDRAAHSSKLINNVDNIDAQDENNMMLVSEYVNDIYTYLNDLEKTFLIQENYLTAQFEVTPKMRSVLIDWIHEAHDQFHLVQETFHMTVSIIDRYLQAVRTTKRQNLQLVGVTALFLASKYEELFPPEIKDFVYITDDTYTQDEIIEMERNILKNLRFQLGRPLPIHFLRRYSKAANTHDGVHLMAKYFIELATVEYSCVHLAPSKIAASSLLLSLCLNAKPETGDQDQKIEYRKLWTPTLEYYSNYNVHTLKMIVCQLAKIVQHAPNAKLKHVYNKFATNKFEKISELSKKQLNILKEIISNETFFDGSL